MSSPELMVKNLKVAFTTADEELVAVQGISYQLNRGETLALVGESGSGKTVSALSILRLIPESPGKILSGEILFDEKDLLKLPHKELRAQAKTIDLLKQVDIPSPEQKFDQYPHQFSGGMRQRVMIAMALSCSPRILIADEPTTALDVLIQAQIIELLKQIKKESQMSILLITHDLGVVAEIAQRVMVMYAGDIVETGPVSELFRAPLHPYTSGLINSVPTLKTTSQSDSRLNEISGTVPSLTQIPSGCPFHPRCPSVETRCRVDKPRLKETAHGHAVSCWLHP